MFHYYNTHYLHYILNYIAQIWTYFSLHIWSWFPNLGNINKRRFSKDKRNSYFHFLFVWNAWIRNLNVKTMHMPYFRKCTITYNLKNVTIKIKWKIATARLSCSLLFHFGNDIQLIFKEFFVNFGEGWHLECNSCTACPISLEIPKQ